MNYPNAISTQGELALEPNLGCDNFRVDTVYRVFVRVFFNGAILMVKNVAGTNGPDILLANVTILGTIYLHILHFSQHLDTHGFQKCVSLRPFLLAMFFHLIEKTSRRLIFFNILWSKSAQN